MQPEPVTPGWPTLIKELTYFMIKSKQTWLRWSNIKQMQQHNAEAGPANVLFQLDTKQNQACHSA